MNRRTMMKGAAALAAAEFFFLHQANLLLAQQASGAVYDPRHYGAKGDGSQKDTVAIQNAIEACTKAGGGTVSLSPGTYLSGTIVLRSNVNLQLQQGAKLLGSPQVQDYYLPEPAKSAFKGPLKLHLVMAYREQNVSITGPGTIDGNSGAFLSKNGRAPHAEDVWKEVAGFNWKLTPYISPMVEFAECNHVLVQDVTLQNAAGWTLRPTGCDGVVIRGIRIRNPIYTPNGDGIDPSGCQNVLITQCDIATGDDAICIKNFDPYGGDWAHPNGYGDTTRLSSNITVSDCKVTTCCNGLKIGVEAGGNYKDITFSNCTVYSNASAPQNEWITNGICLDISEGGSIENVSFSNITMQNVRAPIYIRLQDSYKDKTLSAPGKLSGIKISGLQVTGAMVASSITGVPGNVIDGVVLENIHIETNEPGDPSWATQEVPEHPHAYPEILLRLPAFGLYARHANGVHLQDVHFHTTTNDPRPCVELDDVDGATLNKVDGTGNPGAKQFMVLKDVRNATVQNCVAAENVDVFAAVSGPKTGKVNFLSNNLSRAHRAIDTGSDVTPQAVTHDGRP